MRLNLLLTLVIGLLLGGLGVLALRPEPPALDESAVRAVVTQMLATSEEAPQQSMAQLDPATLNPMIENYLMNDPTILDRMSTKLTTIRRAEQRREQAELIAAQSTAIYDDPNNVILGNPNGDVTLVEMFDYNCGYCRRALPDLATLIAEDSNLKVILKEFPILAEASVDAARVAVLVNDDKDVNYWDFHQQMFSSRGTVTAQTALDVAEKLGMNRASLMLNMAGPGPAEAIQKSYDLARALDISGTPTYIIGDEMIPGAIGIDQLRQRISNMRACGSTQCPAVDAGAPAG